MSTTFDPAPSSNESLTGTYTFDVSHSRLGFSTRHAMVTTVRGHFQEFEGTATLNEADPSASSVEVTAQIMSITTGNDQRDGHLRSADFFEPEAYPTMTFRSTAVEAQGDDDYKVTGDLTIKGTTKSVTFDMTVTGQAKDPFGNTRVGFEGSTQINRKDWGLEWNAPLETGGVLVSEKVKIDLDLSLIKQS